ncbi:hypothetical protein Zm00014a_026485, partial [Zea mays]
PPSPQRNQPSPHALAIPAIVRPHLKHHKSRASPAAEPASTRTPPAEPLLNLSRIARRSSSSANRPPDELFHNGQIRPLTLPPLPDLDPGSDDDEDCVGGRAPTRGRDLTPRSASVHARSMSPLRSASPRLKLINALVVPAPDLGPGPDQERARQRRPPLASPNEPGRSPPRPNNQGKARREAPPLSRAASDRECLRSRWRGWPAAGAGQGPGQERHRSGAPPASQLLSPPRKSRSFRTGSV